MAQTWTSTTNTILFHSHLEKRQCFLVMRVGSTNFVSSYSKNPRGLVRSTWRLRARPSSTNVSRKRFDPRTRHDRTERRNSQWAAQFDALVSAYLVWQAQCDQGGQERTEDADASGSPDAFEIAIVDFFGASLAYSRSPAVSYSTEASKQSFRPIDTSEQVNVTLCRNGYIGTSPISPSIAISFQTIEAYRQLHRVCPRLSVQAFVRALCHLHAVSLRKLCASSFLNMSGRYLIDEASLINLA